MAIPGWVICNQRSDWNFLTSSMQCNVAAMAKAHSTVRSSTLTSPGMVKEHSQTHNTTLITNSDSSTLTSCSTLVQIIGSNDCRVCVSFQGREGCQRFIHSMFRSSSRDSIFLDACPRCDGSTQGPAGPRVRVSPDSDSYKIKKDGVTQRFDSNELKSRIYYTGARIGNCRSSQNTNHSGTHRVITQAWTNAA